MEEDDASPDNELKYRLTDEEVKELRRLYNEDDVSYSELQEMFGLSSGYIGEIIAGTKRVDESYTRTNFSTSGKKLSDEDVVEIRKLYNHDKVTITEIAENYDISSAYVGSLIANKYRYDKDYVRTNFACKRGRKLTKVDVAKIRDLYNFKNVSIEQLSKDYSIGILYLRDIIANKRRVNEKYVRTRFERVGNKIGPKKLRKKPGKVTPEMVKMIREGYNYYNWSYKYLCETYNLSSSAMRDLIANKTHKDENYQQRRFS